MILDGRTVQSTPESGARAGYDGHKKRNGSKVHIAVDTRGNLLAVTTLSAYHWIAFLGILLGRIPIGSA